MLYTLFLSQAYYWQIDAGLGNWWFATRDLWVEKTGLSRRHQENARKLLKGAINEKTGLPTRPVLLEETLVQNIRGKAQLAFRLDRPLLVRFFVT